MDMGVEYSLFNASDDWVLHYVDDDVFDESLLLNILFQDRVLMHESYFFNSSLLSRHLQRATGELSLFEYAALRGLIIPAVRNLGDDCLQAAYATLTGGEVYRDYQLLTPEMAPYRDRIIGAVDAGLRRKQQPVFHWPEPTTPESTLGSRYLELLRSVLQRDTIPRENLLNDDRRQLFQRVWKKSARWRFSSIEDAATRTRANGNKGIQRLELIRSIAWDIGIPRNVMTISPADLMSHSADPEVRLAVEIFIKWLAQCHHLVQAQVFDTAINFPIYDLDEDFVLDSIFAQTDEMESKRGVAPSHETLQCTVRLPPLRSMIQLSPQEVVAIRDDLGEGYRIALRRWQQNPTDDNCQSAIASLRDYCERISRQYERRHLKHLSVTFAQTAMPAFTDGSAALETVASPTLGCLVNCTKTVATIYRFFSNRRIRSRLSPRNMPLEITLAGETRI